MEIVSLNVQSRTATGKKVAGLRAQGFVPGVIYGHGFENRSVSAEAIPFDKILKKAGTSSLVDLSIDGAAPIKVLIHDVQRNPVTNQVGHIDFYHVKMTEKLSAQVPLVLIGESKAVKEAGAILVKTLDRVTVECLPQDLVHELTVDISTLDNFDDAIHVSDIVVPHGITIEADASEVVVTVKAPRTEAEMEADLATPATENVAEVAVEKKGKEAEAAEGEESVAKE